MHATHAEKMKMDTAESRVCAATCQNGFRGVDHGVRAIALRSGLLLGSEDARIAGHLVRQLHAGRLTVRRAAIEGGMEAALRCAGAFTDGQEVGDAGQHHRWARYHRERGVLCAVVRRRGVLSWMALAPRSIASSPPSIAARSTVKAPGMALAYERPRKLEDQRFRKKAGTQCDRSNAVINAAKTILACCGANAAFCGVHFLGMQGMHGARIRWPAGDPSKWSATHERLTRPFPVRRKHK